jgi:LmbE family N-acetylglucosaminyl deacetylase
MSARPAFLRDSAIIVCHPDDEVLWFGSILRQVDEVCIAYTDYWAEPGLGDARRKAMAALPRPVTSLDLPEAGTYGLADWSNPVITEQGIAFKPAARGLRELKRRARNHLIPVIGFKGGVADRCASDRYAANRDRLAEALRPRLHAGMNVFTHNPWGEYGHEDHVQMFRVLDMLRGEIGFKLWMSNYCSDRSLPLAKRYFMRTPPAAIRLPVDKAFSAAFAQAYQDAGCWTWSDDWAWFDDEHFLEAPSAVSDSGQQGHLFPLNLFTIEQGDPERWIRRTGMTSAAAAAGLGLTLAINELV